MDEIEKSDATPKAPVSRRPSVRRFFRLMIGAIVAVLLITIGVVLISGFPGPPQGSADKSDAPPEDVRKPSSDAG